MERQTRLNKLIAESPCRVHLDVKPRHRLYDSSSAGQCWYEPLVEVTVMSPHSGRYLCQYEKFATLAHEIQHARCWLGNCFCKHSGNTGIYYAEYHAYKAQLIKCMDYPQALKDTIMTFRFADTWNAKNLPHKKACKNLMKTKLWKKALRIARKSK